MARQAGMTLIELTVVLLVLIGLAGLMIPYVTGFVGKTHDATGSSNIQQLGNALVRYESQFGSYPDNMDSLVVASGVGATVGSVIDYTMADVMGSDAATAYEITPLLITVLAADNGTAAADPEVCGSLAKAGINSVTDMNLSTVAGFNATFSNSAGTTNPMMYVNSMNTSCAGTVAEISAAKVATALSIDTTGKRYVAFGIGQGSQLVGRTLQEAPVHFAKNADMNASQAYNRFVAIFEVDNDTAVDLAPVDAMRAKYVGSVMLMNDVIGLQTELGNYYKSATDEAN